MTDRQIGTRDSQTDRQTVRQRRTGDGQTDRLIETQSDSLTGRQTD